MKVAASSYSFSQAMRDGRMTMLDVLPKAKELGFDGVEIVRGNQSDEEMRALAKELNRQSKELDMPIVAYLVGADFTAKDVDAEVERLKGEVEIAVLLGTDKMRHDTSSGMDQQGQPIARFEDALERIADGCRRVTEYAAGLGVHTMSENHGFFAQDSHRVKAIMDTVGHKNYGWLVDIGNFLCADEDPASAVKVGAPYAVHAHAKDFHVKNVGEEAPEGWFKSRGGKPLCGAIVGEGQVPVAECVKLLKDAGYDGFVSLEFEGLEDCIEGLSKGLANLRRFIAQA